MNQIIPMFAFPGIAEMSQKKNNHQLIDHTALFFCG
jgi:hypothetical protein